MALEHFQAGRRAEAEQTCRQLVECEPCHAEAHNLLGVLAHQAGQNDLAIERLDQAIRLSPDNAGFHYNRGVALQMLGRHDEAAVSYQQTLRWQPKHADAHHNWGVALAQLGRLREAEKHHREAVRLKPDHVEARHHLGYVVLQQGRPLEAIALFREVVRNHPEDVKAHHNLGLALVGIGDFEEGLAHFEHVLRRRPDDAETRFCRSMVLLLNGDFLQGWPEYEWRWQSRGAPPRRHHQPPWDGAPLAGRTILLHAEQGFGDTIQFIRYAPLVKERGGTVVVECLPGMIGLLGSCAGIDRLIVRGDPLPPCDVQAALMSLPRIFGTTLTTIPAAVPYLAPDPELVRQWQQELSGLRGYKVGIAWQGSPTHLRDASRSIPLRHFAPLARIPGVQLISLQKGRGCEQIALVADQFTIIDPGKGRDDASWTFRETAAIAKNLDLVIACDTSVAHLAGALGVPVWLALPFAPDWRWLQRREDNPWYPTMRLFRQQRLGDWDGVFTRMARELQQRLGLPTHPGDVRVEIATGELIDKITILQIKSERIGDSAKLRNVRAELATLLAERDRAIAPSDGLASLTADLKAVNEQLWEIEDEIRLCERGQNFGPRFIELARSVYHQNDRRAVLKRRINDLLGSALVEEKSYASYAPAPRATVCLLTYGDYLVYFRRCLESVLTTTPAGAIELRLGFNDAPASLAYARQRLRLDDAAERRLLAGDVEQLSFVTPQGMTVRLWNAPVNLYKEPMARLMYHDVPLDSEYAVWLDDDSFVEEGWWQALVPLMERRVDYIGQPWWVDYLPGQTDMIQAQPWYRGVPFDMGAGRIGIWFMTGGFMAVRAERLRNVNFPDTDATWQGDRLQQYGGDTLLGEIARQQEWTRAEHEAHVKVNVDLHGNHPAPRRGGTGRQFGANVQVVIR